MLKLFYNAVCSFVHAAIFFQTYNHILIIFKIKCYQGTFFTQWLFCIKTKKICASSLAVKNLRTSLSLRKENGECNSILRELSGVKLKQVFRYVHPESTTLLVLRAFAVLLREEAFYGHLSRPKEPHLPLAAEETYC